MASVVPMKSLLESGVHFGHRTRRWNPKMKPYIFTERNGIHIIDLQQTIARLNQAYDLVRDTVSANGVILFVGTKRQAQENIVQEATRCHMPYVDQRWLGGTLTNWRTIRQRIDYLLEAEKKQARGEFSRLVKKEALMREKEIARLNHRLGGLKEMRRLPNLMFVVDVRRDSIAVKEANILGIPIIAMVDTNCDPDPIDHVIPSNDDAIRAIKLMLSTMATGVLEGQAISGSVETDEEEVVMDSGEAAQERYLGPSTLAKIQAARSDEPEAEAAAEVAAAEKSAKPEPPPESAPAEPEAATEPTGETPAEPEAATEPTVDTPAEPETTAEAVADVEAEAKAKAETAEAEVEAVAETAETETETPRSTAEPTEETAPEQPAAETAPVAGDGEEEKEGKEEETLEVEQKQG